MKKKVIVTLILLSGCASTVEQQFKQAVANNLSMIAQAHNKIANCLLQSGEDYKKVVPCIKATPVPTPTPVITPSK